MHLFWHSFQGEGSWRSCASTGGPIFAVLVVIVTQPANPPLHLLECPTGAQHECCVHTGALNFGPFPTVGVGLVVLAVLWLADQSHSLEGSIQVITGNSTSWQVESIILRDVFVAIENPEFQVLVSKHWYRYLMIFTVKECKRRKKIWPDTDMANRLFDNVPLGNSVLWELRALVCNLLHC